MRGKEESAFEKETPPNLSIYIPTTTHTNSVSFLSCGSEVAIISKMRGKQLPDLLYTPHHDRENKHKEVLWIRDKACSSMTTQTPEPLLKSGRSKTSQVVM